MILQPFRTTTKSFVVAVVIALLLAIAGPGSASASDDSDASNADATAGQPSGEVLVASDHASDHASDESREGGRGLEPTFQPREPVPEPWYNSDYLFGMTRGVANSTIAPGGKVPLFVLTVPLDIVFLPFAAIGGLFG